MTDTAPSSPHIDADGRVPMLVPADVRNRLYKLLFGDGLRGVGFGGFLTAAMDAHERGDWAVNTE